MNILNEEEVNSILKGFENYKKGNISSCGTNVCKLCKKDFDMYDLFQNVCFTCMRLE